MRNHGREKDGQERGAVHHSPCYAHFCNLASSCQSDYDDALQMSSVRWVAHRRDQFALVACDDMVLRRVRCRGEGIRMRIASVK